LAYKHEVWKKAFAMRRKVSRLHGYSAAAEAARSCPGVTSLSVGRAEGVFGAVLEDHLRSIQSHYGALRCRA